jgi:hypothetical protein
MRLQDRVAASAHPTYIELPGRGGFLLPSAAEIAADVRNAPVRYVLDDDVAALTARTALVDAAQIADCVDLLRMPAPLFWLEWSERGVLSAMAALGVGAPDRQPRAARVGLLVRSDPDGRRGEICIVWEGDGAEPDLSPLRVAFDLDDPTFAGRTPNGELSHILTVEEDPDLTRLLTHARFRLRKEWRKYFALACGDAAQREQALLQNFTMVAADFPFLAAFCLLMSAKNAFAVQPSALDRLNARRAKDAKHPLLDHIEVTARIGGLRADGAPGSVSVRAAARLHFVCGHLVRRGGRVFWRRAHLRGSARRGIITARTICVRAAERSPDQGADLERSRAA